MTDTAASIQAEVTQALQALFRNFVLAATTPTTPAEMLVLSWVQDIKQLYECLRHPEASVDLSAAFMSAVERTTAHEPQSELIEAQLDVGRMGMRHLVALSSGDSMAKSRTADSETNLREAVAWLDKVRAGGSSITKPAPGGPAAVPSRLTEEQELQENDLALEIAVLFREVLRAVSANDRRGAVNQIMFSFNAAKNLAGRIDHSYYFYPIIEQAIDQFQNPERLSVSESDRLDVSRAGLRLLATATATAPEIKKGGYASRRARDTENFDRTVAYLVQTDDWKNQPRYRDRGPDA